jgi:cytoskeletal protein CcmA (bactofilin family)
MKSIQLSAKTVLDASVNAASENLADQDHPPTAIRTFKLGFVCFKAFSFEKLDAGHITMRWGDKNTEVFNLKGKVNAGLLEVLAKCRTEGCINIKNYLLSGYLETAEDINCENFICLGTVRAPSVNASEIHIYPRAASEIKEVMGTRINISKDFDKQFFKLKSKYSISRHLRKAARDNTKLKLENIEADDIYLEYTEAAHVSGKNIVIGPGCNIEHLEYIETVKTTAGSIVGKLEKI